MYKIFSTRNAGLITLPPKAFLLSFDDGYSSFYTRVWPLLKSLERPGSVGAGRQLGRYARGQTKVDFGGLMTPRERFATWEMVRELSRNRRWLKSARIPGLHTTVFRPIRRAAANRRSPTASMIKPADATKATQQFTPAHRLTDVQQSERQNRTMSPAKRRAPGYGPTAPPTAHRWLSPKISGYQLAFTLGDGLGDVRDLDNIPRLLISGNPSIKAFASQVTQIQEREPVRVMHVDLDYVYDYKTRLSSAKISIS